MIGSPAPHPLDFDWRYDRATAGRLARILRDSESAIAFGVPSVARFLEKDRVRVTLVDRQPLQGVKSHIVCSVEDFDDISKYRTAIVDPPWYPQQLRDWTIIAGRAVGTGGTVFVSVWPDHVRPHGAQELTSTLNEISSWATIERDIDRLNYEEPPFEVVARAHMADSELSRSPLIGELVRLRVFRVPQLIAKQHTTERWQRFTVDSYQLAVRLDVATARMGVEMVNWAQGWQWPYVSARAPGRNQIGLWSSAGEVASVADPILLSSAIRAAFASGDIAGFEKALAAFPEILSWRIPRPPYRRSVEWQHPQ